MAHPSISYLELLIRVAVVYIGVLVLLRISGKRQIGQLSAIEFVSIILISNAVQNSMNGGDNSLVGGLVLAMGLVVLSTVTAILSFKHRKFRHFVEGVPTIVIREGKVLEPCLKRERLTREELTTMLRKQNIHNTDHVQIGILESDGTLTVSLKEEFLKKHV